MDTRIIDRVFYSISLQVGMLDGLNGLSKIALSARPSEPSHNF